MAGGPSKVNPPNSHPSNPIHKTQKPGDPKKSSSNITSPNTNLADSSNLVERTKHAERANHAERTNPASWICK